MTDDDTERFRQQAEECRREAEKAISPLDKEAWLKLAADWLRLGQDIEARRKRFFGCSRCDNDGLPFPLTSGRGALVGRL